MQKNEHQVNTISKRLNYLNALNLVMAMFRLTAQDLKYGDKETRQDAKKFLNSAWFRELCNLIDLDSSFVKNVIIKSDKISTRRSYE